MPRALHAKIGLQPTQTARRSPMDEDILPCRWCGGEAMAHGICVRIDDVPEVVAWVECEDCKAKGPSEDTVGDAIATWNAGPRVEPLHVG